MRKYKIGDELWHVCYFITKICDCKTFFGIYFNQVVCKVVDYCDRPRLYKCEFDFGIFNVVENNLSKDDIYPYESMEFRSYCSKKIIKKTRKILDYDRGKGIVDASLVGDLHITYGFPKEESLLTIKEKGLIVDERCIYEYLQMNSG